MSTKHAEAATRFIADRAEEKWHDETLWMVRQKRDKMSHSLPEWERLRQLASAIKLYSNSHLADLLEEFERHAVANGAIVHWAKDAAEHNAIVEQILQQHHAKVMIKSKSMLTEECGMNPYLMEKGYDIIESDLGERILQWMHTHPSHIVMPAIHIKRQAVGRMMERVLGTEPGNSDPTYLTHAVRKDMRRKFLTADVAMTGVNFAVASTGEIVVCTNEGNADMGTSFPKVHIATMGMEKIVPNLESLGIFTRLLARSGTGQPSTAYTAHYRKPMNGQEFHIIIVDNGRSEILGNPEHFRTLNCIRCGQCMNTCPVYRRSGGYSYTYFIPGPIGINLGMLRNPRAYSDNVSACTLCLSCSHVCPAKVDLGEQIYRWRQQLDVLGRANSMKKLLSRGMKCLMERPALFNTALKFAPAVNLTPRMLLYNRLNAWGVGREMPRFAKQSFNEMWKTNQIEK